MDGFCSDAELEEFVALNRIEVRWTGSLSVSTLREGLLRGAGLLLLGRPVLAGCFVVPSSLETRGPVGRWFAAEIAEPHMLIERVLVAPSVRRGGIGRRLYGEVKRAHPGHTLVAAVKTQPRNDASLHFHDAMGFVSIGSGSPFPGTEVSFLSMAGGHE